MKKCPECGNASYDGAPVCGNCGYVFSKTKSVVPKRESIFRESKKAKKPKKPKVNQKPVEITRIQKSQKPEKIIKKENPQETPKKVKKVEQNNKPKKSSNDDSVLTIIKDNKLVIGVIILITILAICGIVLTGSGNHNSQMKTDISANAMNQYSEAGFSFDYPTTWENATYTDSDHEDAIFFDNNDTVIEFYNVTTSVNSLKELTQERIKVAVDDGDSIINTETITVNQRNIGDLIVEHPDGDYTRTISILDGSNLYVFKISGNSVDALNTTEMSDVLNSFTIK